MKWLLIYEFDVKIYRRAPTVRIFLEDVLLNEFTLEKITRGIIEFDYSPKDKNNLTVEMINDDNNYTNGFMTKATYVIPKFLFVVPKFIIKNFDQHRLYYEQRCFSKSNYYIYRRTGKQTQKNPSLYKAGLDYIKHFYKTRTKYPQNLFFEIDTRAVPEEEYRNYQKNVFFVAGELRGKTKSHTVVLDKKHQVMFYKKKKGFIQVNYDYNNLFKKLQSEI